MMTFETYKDRKGEWRWRLLATNGNVIACSGEGYTKKFNCTRVIQRIINGIKAQKVMVKMA